LGDQRAGDLARAGSHGEGQRVNFAMLTTFYPPYNFGGDGIAIRRLSHALARRGHRVEVIHDLDAYRMLAHQQDPPPLEEPPGVQVHRLESPLGALSCLATQQSGRPVVHGRRIRQILAEGHFDVIQYHNLSLMGGPGLLRYGRAVKLYWAHEHWLVCPMHVLWRHGRELCTGRQCVRCSLHYRRPPQLWRWTGLMDREARHVDVFTVPSRFSADKHRELGFSRPMEVLPYFLPLQDGQAVTPEPLREPPSRRPFFLFVGRLEKIKGLQDVIPHFAGEGAADLWVAGDGEYAGALQRQARGHRVHFLGRRTAAELRSLYRETCALVVPSICYETFGIILLEAFREGTPVVARRLGPFTEIVEASGGGLLFQNNRELGECLVRLAADAALRERLGAAGRRALEQNWSEEVVIERYLDLVRRVREKHRSASHQRTPQPPHFRRSAGGRA